MPTELSPQARAALADQSVQDPRRLDAVRDTQLLDTPPEEVFDAMSRLATQVLGVPASFVAIVDAERDFYKSQVGFPEPLATQRELSGRTFCHYTLASSEPLVIADTHADPVWQAVPTVESLGVRAYLGVPLVVAGRPSAASAPSTASRAPGARCKSTSWCNWRGPSSAS